MFKRINKRQLKQQEKEEEGYSTQEDSDDSQSSTSSDDDSDLGERGASEEAASESDGGLTIAQVLENPIYTPEPEFPVRTCAVCAGALLKNDHMVEVHLASNVHRRRMKRFAGIAEKESLDGQLDAQVVIQALEDSHTPSFDKQETGSAVKSGKVRKREEFLARRRKAAADRKEKKRAKQADTSEPLPSSGPGPESLQDPGSEPTSQARPQIGVLKLKSVKEKDIDAKVNDTERAEANIKKRKSSQGGSNKSRRVQ